jgi:hypothetical protein
VRVDFLVNGANTAGGPVFAGAEGKATFCYTGTNAGEDTITGSVGGISGNAAKTWVNTLAVAAVTLAPPTEAATVGKVGCVTATVTNEGGDPIPNVKVDFQATGANSAEESVATGTDGKATFCYTGANAGEDTITALVGGISTSATKTWVKEAPTTTPTNTTSTTSAASSGVLPFKAELPKACTSKRDITIHIQHVHQLGIVSAVVKIDGKDRKTLSGKPLSTAINLVGLPKGTYTVEIVARLRDGRVVKGERTYHTCVSKLPGRSYIPLVAVG